MGTYGVYPFVHLETITEIISIAIKTISIAIKIILIIISYKNTLVLYLL